MEYKIKWQRKDGSRNGTSKAMLPIELLKESIIELNAKYLDTHYSIIDENGDDVK